LWTPDVTFLVLNVKRLCRRSKVSPLLIARSTPCQSDRVMRLPRGREATEAQGQTFNVDCSLEPFANAPDTLHVSRATRRSTVQCFLHAITFPQVGPAVIAAISIHVFDSRSRHCPGHPEPRQPVQQMALSVDADLQESSIIMKSACGLASSGTPHPCRQPGFGVIVQNFSQTLLRKHVFSSKYCQLAGW
jgi:hypothetical protein